MSYDSLGIIGTTIDEKYVIERAAGEGSFSIVYRAMHTVWRLPVALKCFKGFGGVSADVRDRLLQDFIQEGSLLSELSGKSSTIVQARDAGSLLGRDGEVVPYIVLEWLEGRTLENVLEEQRAVFGRQGWPMEKARAVIEPIAGALGMVHRRGIAHRDIKPDNIWVGGLLHSEEMFVKLLDFGIAKVVKELAQCEFRKTKGAVTSFTPAYAAPEQFSRSFGATGPWTDVYSLALVFVELLAGRPAMEGDDFVQLGMSVVDATRRPTPRALGVMVPDAVEHVFAKALSVKPYERFPTVNEFWEAVRQADTSRASAVSGRSETGAVSGRSEAGALVRRAEGDESRPLESRAARGRPVVVTALVSLAMGAAAGVAYRSGVPAPLVHAGQAIRTWIAGVGSLWSRASTSGNGANPPVPASAPPPAPAPATCPDEMAMIPGGKFIMGASDVDADASERPTHEVQLSPFCIDRHEVTVAAYAVCAREGKCERAPFEVSWSNITPADKKVFSQACNGDDPDRSRHPVNCADWTMAVRFCSFAKKRLPTEAEWELAARGTDGRRYAWGNDAPDAKRANFCGQECGLWAKKNGALWSPLYSEDDGFALTAPVGSYPRGRSPYGLFDVAGNVWEWVSDWEGAYSPDAPIDPTGPLSGTRRVLRGGGFNGSVTTWARATWRLGDGPDSRRHAYGFRCASSLRR